MREKGGWETGRTQTASTMGGAAYVVWLTLVGTAVGTQQENVDCSKLEVRFKTMVRRGTKNETDQWVRFNVLDYYCTRREGRVICGGHAFTKKHSVEERVWKTQAEAVEGVIRKGNLWDVEVRVYALFHVAERRQTVYLEVEKEVFVVTENGTLAYCQGNGKERGKKVRDCEECEEELQRRARTEEVAEKWESICKTQGKREGAAKNVKKLAFVCKEEKGERRGGTTEKKEGKKRMEAAEKERDGESDEEKSRGGRKRKGRGAWTGGMAVCGMAGGAVWWRRRRRGRGRRR